MSLLLRRALRSLLGLLIHPCADAPTAHSANSNAIDFIVSLAMQCCVNDLLCLMYVVRVGEPAQRGQAGLGEITTIIIYILL